MGVVVFYILGMGEILKCKRVCLRFLRVSKLIITCLFEVVFCEVWGLGGAI